MHTEKAAQGPRAQAFLGLMLLAAAVAHGGGDGLVETERVKAEIEALRASIPEAAEVERLEAVLFEANKNHHLNTREISEKIDALWKTDAYTAFQEKYDELTDRRAEAWEIERKVMAKELKRLYAARHEEIRGKARRELPNARNLGMNVLSFPRVDGSTSTGPLSVILAARILGLPYEWQYPEPTGNPWQDSFDALLKYKMPKAMYEEVSMEFSLNKLTVAAKPEQPERPEQLRTAMLINSVISASTSTHEGYVNLIEGRSDLILTARAPSASETKLAGEKGAKLILKPIAKDALVFLVNGKNPVKSLSRTQVRDIYGRRLSKWDDLGWPGGPISAYRRERDSGSRELFDALVMTGGVAGVARNLSDLYSSGMEGPFNQVTQNAAGIGYSVYYYEHFMAASPYTRLLAIDGVEPSFETISSGAYPWVTPVYAVCREGAPADSPGLRLLEWLLTEEGQSVVLESGYVPAVKL
ncbi:MAG: substrate-binding domain-containing protein [Kiritimatiellia bacterium]